MRHSLADLVALMGSLPEPGDFPLRALMAAIAVAESSGDPDEFVAHDPPTNPDAGPSSGLFQIHKPDHPAEFALTEVVRLSSRPDHEKIKAMVEIARPVIGQMLEGALHATRILRARGYTVSTLDTMLFVDAAWQAGPDGLVRWAKGTVTGDPREIVNGKRTVAVEVALRHLVGDSLGVASAFSVAFGVLVAFGVAGLILSQWKT